MSSSSSDSDSDVKPKHVKTPAAATQSKKRPASSSDSDSDSEDERPPVKKQAIEATPGSNKPSTALPPVRPPASAAQFTTGGKIILGKDGKVLTKQQINQIVARQKREAETAAAIAKGLPPPLFGKALKQAKKEAAQKKSQEQKKRKQPEPSSSKAQKEDSSDDDDSDSDDDEDDVSSSSDSDSGSDSEAPHKKAAKVSAGADAATATATKKEDVKKEAASTPASAAATPAKSRKEEAKAAKLAIAEAKRAARALKKEKNRAKAEAAGIHPTQRDLQLMNRDLQAEKLWELYATDRKERGLELTPLENDEKLVGKNLAQIPNHESPDSHSFKLLSKHLKSMYGGNYAEQVLGGTIQPALSTKKERHEKKKERSMKEDDEKEEEEQEEVKQKQEHMDNPNIGAPYIVFISPSAIRAVECGRGFKQIPMNTRVVKLFAKHLKIDQQREELSHDVRVAIGTPGRLLKLSQNGFMKWNRCRLIIWDIGKTRKLLVAEAQEKRRIKNKLKKGIEVADPYNIQVKPEDHGNNRKMFTLLSLKDVKGELWKLYEEFLHEIVVKKQTGKLVLL